MSWKQYGGIKNLDSFNNISVGNVIADRFTVRDRFLTEFEIIGDTKLFGNVVLGDNTKPETSIKLNSRIITKDNVDISGNLSVNGKLIITSDGVGFFLKGTDDNKLGINIENPLATLDIAGSYESILNVYSDQSNNRNIIARNYLDNGIAVNTIDASSSSLQFYSGSDISNNKNEPDSEIKYLKNGILEIITGEDTRILSQVSISTNGSKGHIHDETMIVYDISNGTYKNLYYKDDTIIKGNAFSLIAHDSSANTSMNITTPNGIGGIISGGAYPEDVTRSMLTMDVSNNSGEKPPAQMIVSGQNEEKCNATTSINKYISQVDQYSLDVNGATYIADSQINIQEDNQNMTFLKVASYEGYVLAGGSYDTVESELNIYQSDNSGVSWSKIDEFFSDKANETVKDIFMNNRVRCIIIQQSTSPTLYVSINATPIDDGIFTGYSSLALPKNDIDTNVPCSGIYSFFTDLNNHFIVARNQELDIFTTESTGNFSLPYDVEFIINDVKGFENTIYAVGEGGNIKSYTVNISMTGTTYNDPTNIFAELTTTITNPSKTYKRVFVYDANTVIAVGDGIITYTHDGGSNWYSETTVVSDISLNDVHIKSKSEAIVVGDNGKIFVSHDAYRTWTQLDNNYINGGGTGKYLTGETDNDITSITMTSDNNIITTHKLTTTPNNTGRLLLTYAPSVLNRDNSSTLDVIGSIKTMGDLVLHERGELKTTDASFGLLKTNTTRIDFGLSGELINIGAYSGLVDMKGRLQVADDVSFNSKLDVIGETKLHGFLDVSNSAHVKEELTVDNSLNVTEIYGITDDIINMSTSSGLVDMKGRLQVADDVSFNSDIYVTENAILYSNLDVCGNTMINGSLTVDGSLNFKGLLSQTDISHNVLISDQLKVHNIADNEVALVVQQDIITQPIAEFKKGGSTKVEITKDGDIEMNSSVLKIMDTTISNNVTNNTDGALYVKGGTRLDGNLNVMGETYFASNITFVGEVTSLAENKTAIINVTSNNSSNNKFTYEGISLSADKTSNFNVDGGANFKDSIVVDKNFYGHQMDISGDASFNADVFINGDISANTNLYLGGDASLNADLFVSGDISANTKFYLGGDASFNADLFVSGDISANTNLYLGGDASLNADLFVGGQTTLGTSTNTGVPLYVDGSGAMRIPVGNTSDRDGFVDETGQIRFNTTDDTFEGYDGSNWGSLGGVSNPNKTTQVYVDDNNSIMFKTNGEIRETIDGTTGDISINTVLITNGDISANTNLYLAGDASLNSNLFVSGDISANTKLFLGGDASLNADLFVSGQTRLGTTSYTGVPLRVDGTGAMRIPVGTQAQQPTVTEGHIRFNTDDDTFEGYDGSNWGSLGGVSNADKSSRVFIDEHDSIVFKTNNLTRETIAHDGKITFDVSNSDGHGSLDIEQNYNATILRLSDNSNNNGIVLQNQGALKLMYNESGLESNRIQMASNEIRLNPKNPTTTMLVNENGALVGNDNTMLNKLRNNIWNEIGYKGINGTKLGNTVSISRNGKRIAFGEYEVNSTDVSSNIWIYDVFEREIVYLDTIQITDGNASSIALNDDGSRIIIGKYNADPNGEIEYYKYDTASSGYNQISIIGGGTDNESQLGHTTSINNNGNIFAAGQYTTNEATDSLIEGGVLIFKYNTDSSIEKIADISLNYTTGTHQQMGRSIQLNGDGNRLIIGGTINKSTSTSIYEVYIYESSGYYWGKKLTITNPGVGTNFGISVAMSNDGKVISVATQEDLNSTENTGKVYVYDLSGSGVEMEAIVRGSAITLDPIDDGDTFGSSMSLNDDGSVLAIGCGSHNGFNGKAFIYKYVDGDWIEIKTFNGGSNSNLGGIHDYNSESGRLVSDEDGICLDGTGELVIIGAPNLFTDDGNAGSGNGKVYLHRNQIYTLGVNKKLHVNGVIAVDNGDIDVNGQVGISQNLRFTGAGSQIDVFNKDFFDIAVSERDYSFRIRNSTSNINSHLKGGLFIDGNVGIGTNSPHASQHIHTDSNIDASFVGASLENYSLLITKKHSGSLNTQNGLAFLTMQSGGINADMTTPGAAITFDRTGNWSKGKLHFKTKTNTDQGGDVNTQMTISDNGNVGIGTNSPTAPLHVYSGEETTEIQDLLKLQHGDHRPMFNFQSTNHNYGWDFNTGFLGHGMSLSTAGGKKITCQTNGANIFSSGIVFSGGGGLRFYTHQVISATTDTDVLANTIERMVINNDGNVGIGTTDPQAKLDIQNSQTSTANTNPFIRLMPSSVIDDGTGLTGIYMCTSTNQDHGISLNAKRYEGGSASPSLVINTHRNNTIESRITMDKDGNVGIGTTNPTAKLHVNGRVKVGNINGTGSMAISNNTNSIDSTSWIELLSTRTVIGGPVIQFFTNSTSTSFGSQKMVITSGGNVGIGTTNPTAKLNVELTTGEEVNIGENLKIQNDGKKLVLHDARLLGDDNGNLNFYTDNDGEATNNPTLKLMRNKDSLFYGKVAFYNDESLNSGAHNDSLSKAKTHYKSKEQKIDFVRDSHWIYSGHHIDTIGQIKCGWSHDDYGSWNGDGGATYYYPYFAAMKFSVAPNNGASSYGTRVDDGDFVQMTILSNGNVGIGTESPIGKLTINTKSTNIGTTDGDSIGSHDETTAIHIFSPSDAADVNTISAAMKFVSDTNNVITPNGKLNFYLNNGAKLANTYGAIPDERVMTLVGDGKVGIGTDSPLDKLDVNGNIRVRDSCIRLQNSGSNMSSNGRIALTKSNASDILGNEINGSIGLNENERTDLDAGFLRLSAGGGTSLSSKSYIDLYGYQSRSIAFGTSGQERMCINADGNVGIGTDSPQEKLHVNGTVKATSFEGDGSALTGVGVETSTGPINITNRIDTGIYEVQRGDGTLLGYPSFGYAPDWIHLWVNTHSNVSNNYSSQFAAPFNTQRLYYRNTNGSGNTAWNKVLLETAQGKVGIGTDSPDCLLHVADSSENTSAINVPNGIRVSSIIDTGQNNVRLSALDSINTNSNATANVNALRIYSYIQQNTGGLGCKSEMLMGTRCDGNGNIHESRAFISYDNNFTIYKHVSPDNATSAASKISVATANHDPKIGLNGTETPTSILTCNPSGNVGIGSTDPTEKLEVNGTVKATSFIGDGSNLTGVTAGSDSTKANVNSPTFTGTVTTGNVLRVGTNTNNATSKTIHFGGTYGDNDYNHCVIENRVYSTGTEKHELLLFSGNDPETSAGPDRIRLKGANICFDTGSVGVDRTTELTKMIIDVDGNVGIGNTNPTSKLHVMGTCNAEVYKGTTTGDYGSIEVNDYKNSWAGYSIGGKVVFMSNTSGSAGIYDDINNKWMIYAVPNSYTELRHNGVLKLRTASDGVTITGTTTATTFNATSDIRVKTNIKSIEPNEALKQINKLEPKTYKFNDSEETHYGLVAQDAEKIIPEAVNSNGTKMIPSICETCKLINDGKTIVLDTKTTTDMVVTKLEFDDLSGNKQSVGIESFEGDKCIHLKSSIEEHAVKSSNGLTVFIHGHEVNDFRSINYNTIVATSIAATKALTTELNETRTELNETRTELNETRTELNETRTELNELKRLVEQLLNK